MLIFLQPSGKRRDRIIGQGIYSDVYELVDEPDRVLKVTRCNGRVLSSIMNELSIFSKFGERLSGIIKVFEVYMYLKTQHGRRPRIIVEVVMEKGIPYHRLTLSDSDRVKLGHQFLTVTSQLEHHGILHGDLKTDNIVIIQGSDNEQQLKLIDFGSSLWHWRNCELQSWKLFQSYVPPQISCEYSDERNYSSSRGRWKKSPDLMTEIYNFAKAVTLSDILYDQTIIKDLTRAYLDNNVGPFLEPRLDEFSTVLKELLSGKSTNCYIPHDDIPLGDALTNEEEGIVSNLYFDDFIEMKDKPGLVNLILKLREMDLRMRVCCAYLIYFTRHMNSGEKFEMLFQAGYPCNPCFTYLLENYLRALAILKFKF